MLDAPGGLEYLVAGVGAVSILAGVVLAVRAARSAVTGLVALWFVLFGIVQILVALGVSRGERTWTVTAHLLDASLIAFGLLYPASALSRRQRWYVIWLFVALGILGVIHRGPLPTGRPSALLTGFFDLFATNIVALIMMWHWVRAQGEHTRAQIAWVVVPLAFWVVHDGLDLNYMGIGAAASTATPIGRAAIFAYAGVALAAVALVACFALWCLAVSLRPDGAGRQGARRLGLWLAALFPIGFVQFAVPEGAQIATHFILDGLALFVLFYGVARYRVLDLDLRIRWGIKQGTVAAFFIATFFIGTEIAQQFVGETVGSSYVGIAAAGALAFALAPVQRLAERLSARAVPVPGGTDAYLTYRRLHIYRAALEGALKDGTVQPWEADSLRALRRELQIGEEEHALIERELRGLAASSS